MNIKSLISTFVLVTACFLAINSHADLLDNIEQDWGVWNNSKKATSFYEVSVDKKIQLELNELDSSRLLNNANGVKVYESTITKEQIAPRNIQEIIEELEYMETELTEDLIEKTEF